MHRWPWSCLSDFWVKNAVLIVEFAVQKKAEEGIPVAKAAIEGAAIRFRPILMTSFAFIAGLIPLVIATGPEQLVTEPLVLQQQEEC